MSSRFMISGIEICDVGNKPICPHPTSPTTLLLPLPQATQPTLCVNAIVSSCAKFMIFPQYNHTNEKFTSLVYSR